MHSLRLEERWSIYQAVVYMAWSDRRLDTVETSAARAVAEELDLCEAMADAVLRAGPRPLGELGLDRLAPWGRLVAYASAAWTALADVAEHRAERAVLRGLRYRLGLSAFTADLLESSVVLLRAHGGRPRWRTEYRALLQAVLDVVPAFEASEHPKPMQALRMR